MPFVSNPGAVGSNEGDEFEPRKVGLLTENLRSVCFCDAGTSVLPRSILPLPGAGVEPLALPIFALGIKTVDPPDLVKTGADLAVAGTGIVDAGFDGIDGLNRVSARGEGLSIRPDDREGLDSTGAEGTALREGAGAGLGLGAGAGFELGTARGLTANAGRDDDAGACRAVGDCRGAGAGLDRGADAVGCDRGDAPLDDPRDSDPLSLANATVPASPRTIVRNQVLDMINSLPLRAVMPRHQYHYRELSLGSRMPCRLLDQSFGKQIRRMPEQFWIPFPGIR